MKRGRITLTCCVAAVAVTCATAMPAYAGSWAPDAGVLARAGVRVTWPLHQQLTTLRPGTRLTVTVQPAGTSRAGHVVDVAFLRVTARGVPIRVVDHHRLRSGRYLIKLPAGDGRTYALRLGVTNHRWQSLVATPAPLPVPSDQPSAVQGSAPSSVGLPALPSPTRVDDGASAGSVIAPVDPYQDLCAATSGASAALTLGATSAVADARVPDTLTIGPTCMDYGEAYWWERRNDDGTWTEWPWPPSSYFPTIGYTAFPHDVIHGSVHVPADATTGHYRVVKQMDALPREGPSFDLATGRPVYDVTVTAELDVVAAPAS